MSPDIVQALVRTIEMKDLSTVAHTWRVVLYTRAMAEAAGIDRPTIRRLTIGAALHDVGKIDVPDEILQKPGRLNDDEFEVIKAHAPLGYDRLVRMGEQDQVVLHLVRHHHERFDGKGYPDGLKGYDIPMGARYFSVIDTFDALTSLRPYRRDLGPQAAVRALEEIHKAVGTRYCRESVEAFTRLYRNGSLGWIMEHFNDSCPVPAVRELAEDSHTAVTIPPGSPAAAWPRIDAGSRGR